MATHSTGTSFARTSSAPPSGRLDYPDGTYDLPHSHASVMIDLGVNLLGLAQRLGHIDPAMTLRLYGHLFEGAQAELTARIDALRSATEPTEAAVIPLPRSKHL
jgi:hypothetical protein